MMECNWWLCPRKEGQQLTSVCRGGEGEGLEHTCTSEGGRKIFATTPETVVDAALCKSRIPSSVFQQADHPLHGN